MPYASANAAAKSAVMQKVQHVQTDKVVELATATWSNCLRIGNEICMSGMTAHPASRQAQLDTYQQTLVVLGKVRDLVLAAGGSVGTLATRSAGITARNATTPVKRGLSAPNMAVRTAE